jgi:16S rRNA (cytidine1402-2'-O)-methyltransferase
VVPIPGPSSITTALSASGLPTHEFHYFGFAPKKEKALEKKLSDASELQGTLVYFESPNRLVAFLETASRVLGDRRAVVARELTKLHEELARGSLSELAAGFAARTVKGEVVILIRGRS